MSEAFFDAVRRSWLPFLALLLLLLLLIRLEAQSADRDHGQKEANETKLFADQMSDFVTGLSAWVDMQNKLIGKIENILSGKMPPEWEDRLKNLEDQVANSRQWPNDTDETRQFSGEVSDLGTSLSPWAEANYLPRLLLVRWAATAFNYLDDSQNRNKLLNNLAMAEAMRAWVDARPDGNAAGLGQELRDKADEVEEKQIGQAIQWAEEYLDGKAKPDIESIADFLGRYENDSAQDDPKKTEVVRIRKELESKFHREFEEQQDQARRAYQKWALGEIKKFRGKFLDVIDGAGQVSEEARRGGWLSWSRWTEEMRSRVKDNFREEHYKKIHDAMICHLLPVDLALLDLPVLKLYHQAFDNGWALLDERKEEQNCVAEKSAVTPKMSLRAVLNGRALLDGCKEQNYVAESLSS